MKDCKGRLIAVVCLLLLGVAPCKAQADSVSVSTESNPYGFKPAQLVLPAALVGVSLIGLESDWLKYQNREIREELQENIDRRLTIDNFTQYAPMVSAYGLKLLGVKSRHSYKEMTLILGTAYALMGGTVCLTKSLTRVERPDGTSRNSFPSGHTATAFMGAELLRREYWDVSPWIGMAGYAVAAGTGFFRMYNNRHWLTDVVVGAGIGVFSIQAAYWLYPLLSEALFRKTHPRLALIPYMNDNDKGITCALRF